MSRVIITLISALAFTACGEDADPAADGATLAVPPETRLSELSEDQQHMLCEEGRRAVDAAAGPDFECLLDVVPQSTSAASCQVALTQCRTDKAAEAEETSCATLDADLSTCDATVELYRACIADFRRGFDQFLGQLTCANAAEMGIEEAIGAVFAFQFSLENCAELAAQCPDEEDGQVIVPDDGGADFDE